MFFVIFKVDFLRYILQSFLSNKYIGNFGRIHEKFPMYFATAFIDWLMTNTQNKHSQKESNFFQTVLHIVANLEKKLSLT